MTLSQWIIISLGIIICLISFGTRSTMGFFLTPVSDSYGWEREIFAFSIALQNLFWGIMSPLTGYLSQKFGNTKIIIIGALLYCLGLILTAYANSPWMIHISAGIIIGTGISATSFGILLPAMAKIVPKNKRALILGMGTAGGSAGQFIMVFLVKNWLVEFGWKESLFYLGLVVILIAFLAIPLSLKSLNYSTDKDKNKDSEETEEQYSIATILKYALNSPSYRYVILGFFVCGFHLAFVGAHFPSYLMDQGFSLDIASTSIALIGFFNIAGAYLSGVLANRYQKKNILFFIYFSRTLLIASLIFLPTSTTKIYIFSILSGLLWLSTIPPTSGLVETFFGTKYMAMLYGIVFLNHQIGSFFGVWLGGYLFDKTGSYDLVWYLAMSIAFVSALIHIKVIEKPHYSFIARKTPLKTT